jgi:hypothetical protein
MLTHDKGRMLEVGILNQYNDSIHLTQFFPMI